MPCVSSRASTAAGDGWAMLPSAAAFVDPLFSTGIPMTLLGIERLAEILKAPGPRPQGPGLGQAPGLSPCPALRPEARALGPYSDSTLSEADHTARFIAGCYAAFPRFDVFTAYSMFYFVSASFSEMARRLTPDRSSRGFLCANDPQFGPAIAQLSPAVNLPRDAAAFERAVASACEPLNIAGLCDPVKRNAYGVDVEDTVRSAFKLGLSADQVRDSLNVMMGRGGR